MQTISHQLLPYRKLIFILYFKSNNIVEELLLKVIEIILLQSHNKTALQK